ncbi:MAG: DUF721 domain-containing protein [Pseudomonadota bacterium]|jgi:hypothetical protein|nr:DUF721 domain-containing protein [Alphaproteobacteria bacterium]
MATLQYLISRTLKPLRSQKAYKEAMLLHDWETIVGVEFSKGFTPVEIYNHTTGKILKLVTTSSGMATARYVEPILLQRINQFFGSPYIAGIKTTQGQIKRQSKKQQLEDDQPISTLDEALHALGKHFNG